MDEESEEEEDVPGARPPSNMFQHSTTVDTRKRPATSRATKAQPKAKRGRPSNVNPSTASRTPGTVTTPVAAANSPSSSSDPSESDTENNSTPSTVIINGGVYTEVMGPGP